MEYIKRFQEVLPSLEIQLTHSLPVFNTDKEIMFFYKISEVGNTDYKIDEIRYVLLRDIKSENAE